MRVDISEEPITSLAEYADIPIAFKVSRVFDVAVSNNVIPNVILVERPLDLPYVKNYDAINGEGPANWAGRFDISNWVIFAARVEGRRVGGAIVAFDTPGLDMLEDHTDIALLWDIRVAPEAHGRGVGSALFRAAENLARIKGCRRLKIETQNINVSACKFYGRHGCVIGSVDHSAYPELPDEIQLIWYKDIF